MRNSINSALFSCQSKSLLSQYRSKIHDKNFTVSFNSAKEIANQLSLSYSYVRKELSRSYAVLLPDAAPSDDLKTTAVLKYMELMRLS